MKFSLVNPNICLDDIKDEILSVLEDAKEKYNSIYNFKRGTGRMIESVDVDSPHILITLKSTEKLYYPSKAMSRYSRILVDSGKVDNLIYNRRLFVCDKTQELETEEDISISDSELIAILAKWIIDSSADSPSMQKRKRELIDSFKEKVKEIKRDDDLLEDWGL
jgi:hypothetical protein